MMNKKQLIRTAIFFALATQISHAAKVFFQISDKTNFDFFMSWVFAFSLELSIFIFSISGKKTNAIIFGFVSWSINILTYWFEIGFTQKFVAMNIISAVIPIIIYYYSELINEENSPKMGRPPKVEESTSTLVKSITKLIKSKKK